MFTELLKQLVQFLSRGASRPPASTNLDEAGLVWFNELRNQYAVLKPALSNPSPAAAAAISAIDGLLNDQSQNPSVQDLFDLENWLLELLPLDLLKQRVSSLRDEYQDVFGDEAWRKIQPSLQPNVGAANNIGDLKADARRLQEELHYHSSILPWANRMRQAMMLGVLCLVLLLTIACVIMEKTHSASLGGMLILAGVLGGTISTIQRIQSSDLANSRALRFARYEKLVLGVIISPLLGGIFALLITLLLVAGAVTQGSVIPTVSLQCAIAGTSNVPPARVNKESQAAASRTGAISASNSVDAAASITQSNGLPTITNAAPAGPSSTGGRAKSDSAQSDQIRVDFFNMIMCFGSGKDVALLLLWAFLAGFSERLVPDLLTRVSAQKQP